MRKLPCGRVENFAQKCVTLFLGLWIGSLICTASIVAPAVFLKSESRTQAGQIFGEVLLRLNKFEFLLLAMVLGIKLLVFWKVKALKFQRLKKSNVLLLFSFLIWFYYAQCITPEMHHLRTQIQSFDTQTVAKTDQEVRARFNTLHKRYGRAMAVNLALGVVMIFTL